MSDVRDMRAPRRDCRVPDIVNDGPSRAQTSSSASQLPDEIASDVQIAADFAGQRSVDVHRSVVNMVRGEPVSSDSESDMENYWNPEGGAIMKRGLRRTMRNETKQNEKKRNETKRNETKRNQTKPNETKRNKTKRNEHKIFSKLWSGEPVIWLVLPMPCTSWILGIK